MCSSDLLLLWLRMPISGAVRGLFRAPGEAGPHLALLAAATAIGTVFFITPYFMQRELGLATLVWSTSSYERAGMRGAVTLTTVLSALAVIALVRTRVPASSRRQLRKSPPRTAQRGADRPGRRARLRRRSTLGALENASAAAAPGRRAENK